MVLSYSRLVLLRAAVDMITDERPPDEMASGRPSSSAAANRFGFTPTAAASHSPRKMSSPTPTPDLKGRTCSSNDSPGDSGVFDMSIDLNSGVPVLDPPPKPRRATATFPGSPLVHSRIPVSGRKALVSGEQVSPETSPGSATFKDVLQKGSQSSASGSRRPTPPPVLNGFSQIPRPRSASPNKALLSPSLGVGLGLRAPSPSPTFAKNQRSVSAGNTGTGKVIGDLQNDLAASRAALESTKAQLRLSQRAVEYLGRQTDDLKDGKERLRLENESLARTLARKERSLEEALTRAKAAEGSLTGVREAHRRIQAESVKSTEEAEERVAAAEGRATKAESEYEALRSGVSRAREEWQRQAAELRAELETIQGVHAKELEEAKLSHHACECRKLACRTPLPEPYDSGKAFRVSSNINLGT
jgi:hypothetical protein